MPADRSRLAKTGKRVADAMVRFPKTHGPASRLDEIRAFFEDDHVHMALIVATDRRLVTTIERPDLDAAMPGAAPAAELGTLTGRTARPADRLETSTAVLLQQRRRRLAVVDETGRLLGLLCLKKDGTGYCSDKGIRERANQSLGLGGVGSPRNWGRVRAAGGHGPALLATGVLPVRRPAP